MRVFVVTVCKRRLFSGRQIPPNVEKRIEVALSQLPWREDRTTRRESWVAESGAVRIDAATNEPESTGPLIYRHPGGRAATWTGHIDDPTFTGDNPTADIVAALPGCFALATADDAVAHGFTAVHRMEQLYIAEGRDVHVLSTSARVAHTVTGRQDSRPPLDALIGLSGPGFMITNSTPFGGVEAVPAESNVTMSASGTKVGPLPPADIDPNAPLDVLADALTEALLTAANMIGQSRWVKTVHLTGGKDSRLAAAVLTAAGADFTAVTTGLESHPDVVIGRRLAALLGVKHEVRPVVGAVADSDIVEVRPVRRAYHALWGCEGMLSCFETISVGGRYNDDAVTLGGHGGELLRGGFAYGFPPESVETTRRRLEHRTSPHRHLLTREAQTLLDRMVSPWIEAITTDPHRGSERFYRIFRTGRWHAVARNTYGIRGPQRSILADNQVVRIAAAARQELAAAERLTHAVIHRLRPDLCSVPLFSKRWNFERTSPSTDCDPDGWVDREPLPGGEQVAWNWRISYTPELHRHFADVVLAAPLYQLLLDRSEVERFLADTLEHRSAAQAQIVWSLYTASQLMSGLGSGPTEPEGPIITIPIPLTKLD